MLGCVKYNYKSCDLAFDLALEAELPSGKVRLKNQENGLKKPGAKWASSFQKSRGMKW